MDWDEPERKTAIEVGEDLSSLSVEELQQRITTLEREIERVRAEIKTKERRHSAAEDIFRG